jgi:hypothetical protein
MINKTSLPTTINNTVERAHSNRKVAINFLPSGKGLPLPKRVGSWLNLTGTAEYFEEVFDTILRGLIKTDL